MAAPGHLGAPRAPLDWSRVAKNGSFSGAWAAPGRLGGSRSEKSPNAQRLRARGVPGEEKYRKAMKHCAPAVFQLWQRSRATLNGSFAIIRDPHTCCGLGSASRRPLMIPSRSYIIVSFCIFIDSARLVFSVNFIIVWTTTLMLTALPCRGTVTEKLIRGNRR